MFQKNSSDLHLVDPNKHRVEHQVSKRCAFVWGKFLGQVSKCFYFVFPSTKISTPLSHKVPTSPPRHNVENLFHPGKSEWRMPMAAVSPTAKLNRLGRVQ